MTNLQVALALLVQARFSWGASEVGYLFGLVGLYTLVVQGILIGRLARRFGQIELIIAGTLLLGTGMALISIALRPAIIIVGLSCVGMGLGLVNPLLSSVASELAGPDQQGAVLGFAQSSGGLARTIGPYLGGVLFSRVSTGAPFVGGAIAAAISLTLSLTLRSTRSAPPAAP